MARTPDGLNRRAFALSAAACAALPTLAHAHAPFAFTGRLQQGGFLFGRTEPGAPFAVDGKVEGQASSRGLFVVGFDRDAPPRTTVAVLQGGHWAEVPLTIAPSAWDIQRIDGLPPQTVTPTDPEVLKRIEYEHRIKAAAFASRDAGDAFAGGFILPLASPVRTSPFGVQRVLNGEPKAPHYGVDLAAPEGTPVHAPADGLVVLAAPDLFLDGGLALIDHGQGLISMYLHQSRLDVVQGQRIVRGQMIGAVGMKGRATGPHLCWRMSWRGRHLDPSLMIGTSAPA